MIFDAESGPVEGAVYQRETLPAGAGVEGPAIIGQVDATTLLPPGSSGRVDEYGNLVITVSA